MRQRAVLRRRLALARRLSNLHEEAKAVANLGRLAMARMDNAEAMVSCKQALPPLSHWEQCLMSSPFTMIWQASSWGKKIMCELRRRPSCELRYAKRLGYPDLWIKALTDLADCEAHTGRGGGQSDYAFAFAYGRERATRSQYPLEEIPMQTHRFPGDCGNRQRKMLEAIAGKAGERRLW